MWETDWTLRERLRAIVEDHLSGASALTERTAQVLDDAVACSRAATVEAVRAEVLDIGAQVIGAHPNMAPLVHLVNAAVRAVAEAATPEDARLAIRRALERFRREQQEHVRALQERVSDLIPDGARVLIHSFSSTVLSALDAARARGRSVSIVCTESRPLFEGRRTAEHALALGLPVTLIVDAAIGEWAGRCTLALVGADCVSPEGVTNKIGTRLLALAAREHGIPVYALAESSKFFPVPLRTARAHSPTEVWEMPPAGLTIWNEYFETTPLEAFAGICSESGLLSPEDVRRRIRDLSLDERLWARLRSLLSAMNCS
jgi:translation initiation factor eIF-2B subunit delta